MWYGCEFRIEKHGESQQELWPVEEPLTNFILRRLGKIFDGDPRYRRFENAFEFASSGMSFYEIDEYFIRIKLGQSSSDEHKWVPLAKWVDVVFSAFVRDIDSMLKGYGWKLGPLPTPQELVSRKSSTVVIETSNHVLLFDDYTGLTPDDVELTDEDLKTVENAKADQWCETAVSRWVQENTP